jgi:hypothetical protein
MSLHPKYFRKFRQISTTVTKELTSEEFIELAETHRDWIKSSKFVPPTRTRKRGKFIVVIDDGNLHLTRAEF